MYTLYTIITHRTGPTLQSLCHLYSVSTPTNQYCTWLDSFMKNRCEKRSLCSTTFAFLGHHVISIFYHYSRLLFFDRLTYMYIWPNTTMLPKTQQPYISQEKNAHSGQCFLCMHDSHHHSTHLSKKMETCFFQKREIIYENPLSHWFFQRIQKR